MSDKTQPAVECVEVGMLIKNPNVLSNNTFALTVKLVGKASNTRYFYCSLISDHPTRGHQPGPTNGRFEISET